MDIAVFVSYLLAVLATVNSVGHWMPLAQRSVACGILGVGMTVGAGPSAFATTIDIGGRRVPQVAGMMNMIGNFAAGACPILVGRLFQTTENWNLILLLFAGVFLLGAICWLFVNPQTGIRLAEREPCAT